MLLYKRSEYSFIYRSTVCKRCAPFPGCGAQLWAQVYIALLRVELTWTRTLINPLSKQNLPSSKFHSPFIRHVRTVSTHCDSVSYIQPWRKCLTRLSQRWRFYSDILPGILCLGAAPRKLHIFISSSWAENMRRTRFILHLRRAGLDHVKNRKRKEVSLVCHLF